MNRLSLHFSIIILVMATLCVHAEETHHDTIYFFNTWEQMLYFEPVSMLQDPFIYEQSPLQVYFEIEDEKWNSVIDYDFLGASIGDSIWYVNSNYLKEHFEGDVNLLKGYIPLFFNEKVAYFRYGGYSYGDSNIDHDYGLRSRMGSERTINHISWQYYNIDFEKHELLKVTHTVLSKLLADYHDLQMRYEGMKDYKKHEVIEDYFLKYIERASSDVWRPSVLDLVDYQELKKK